MPSEDHAPPVQGEVIHSCGKISRELLGNGSCNWSREYKRLPQALPDYFSMGNPIPASAFSSSLQPNQQQDENKELAALAKSIHADSTEEDLYRLTELTVKWVIANPQPIKLKQVNYQRQQNKTGISFKRHHRAAQKGNTWQAIGSLFDT